MGKCMVYIYMYKHTQSLVIFSLSIHTTAYVIWLTHKWHTTHDVFIYEMTYTYPITCNLISWVKIHSRSDTAVFRLIFTRCARSVKYLYISICVYVRLYVCARACTQTPIHTRIHTRTYKCIHMHPTLTCTHTHTNAQMHKLSLTHTNTPTHEHTHTSPSN